MKTFSKPNVLTFYSFCVFILGSVLIAITSKSSFQLSLHLRHTADLLLHAILGHSSLLTLSRCLYSNICHYVTTPGVDILLILVCSGISSQGLRTPFLSFLFFLHLSLHVQFCALLLLVNTVILYKKLVITSLACKLFLLWLGL
jgi:hypothetical protein